MHFSISQTRIMKAFKVVSFVIYHCFETDYLKPKLRPINIGTNINIIPVCSVTRLVNPFNSKVSIYKYLKKKKKKKQPKKAEPTS